MITNDELAARVGCGLEVANQILQRAWEQRVLPAREAGELCARLADALAAAEELNRRAGGPWRSKSVKTLAA